MFCSQSTVLLVVEVLPQDCTGDTILESGIGLASTHIIVEAQDNYNKFVRSGFEATSIKTFMNTNLLPLSK